MAVSRGMALRSRAVAKGFVVAIPRGIVALAVVSTLLILALRWVDPPTTSFMLQRWIGIWLTGRGAPHLRQEWVDWEDISPSVPLAVVAAEDQRFPSHNGFDLVEMERAWRRFRGGGRLRGASTISQQVAKNLFLWRQKSWVRKGLEAWLTLVIELGWPKRRILEVYLNIAQLGPKTYGVGAASRAFFGRPPSALREKDAALLAAVLPNPERFRLDAPSAHVRKRADWIRRQMRQLGTAYLEGL
jgi:monofunctional biosynthetic peptidoglycan transglycosylase